ncbi:MAG: SLC13 family permease [Cryomorphaceae bacterium]|nr:MAG: SLC13 family permease [Cryomorphaceae bacterium]
MTTAAIITLIIIGLAIGLFVWEKFSADLVALLAMVALVFTGVLTPEEGIAGFANPATITVAFMFVISAALLKTGAMQVVALRLAAVFKTNFNLGMFLMLLLIAVTSAFINNTPVVAVFLPVVIKIAHSSGKAASKMLIPLSYASILGGVCTLIGTSTNLLVNGMAVQRGLPAIGMFEFTLMGLVFLVAGLLYIMFAGIRVLPTRKLNESLQERYELRKYLSEIELLPESPWVGHRIMDSELARDVGLDIIEVRRGEEVFPMPPGDFVLRSYDKLKVRCDVEKLKTLKDRERISMNTSVKLGDNDLMGAQSSLVELVVTVESEFVNKTLKEVDFRRSFRAIPIGIRHREALMHDHLYDVILQPGDIILAEVKTHYVEELRKMEQHSPSPFILLSEDKVRDFDQAGFRKVLAIVAAMVGLVSFGVLSILPASVAAVVLLVLIGQLNMKELYQAINWKIVFLMAGTLSFGAAMHKSGLDVVVAGGITTHVGMWGPIAVLSALYLITSLFTEIMSNTAAAALMTPIAISAALGLDVSVMPFLIAVMFAASASFMTPIGYQTNTMVYGTGHYRFADFLRIGAPLNLLLWILATLLIPVLFPF